MVTLLHVCTLWFGHEICPIPAYEVCDYTGVAVNQTKEK